MNNPKLEKNYLPSISIVIPTLNSEPDISKFFASLNKQLYPKNRLEILAVDGGSTDNTVQVLKKYGVKVINNPYRLAEPGISLGMNKAKNDLIMVLALDNFYNDKNALIAIAKVFDDDKIFAAFPKHDSESNYSIFSKYHNIFTDPFNHFVYGYAANARTFHHIYKTLESNSVYDLYDYLSNKTRPMIAFAQGFTIRKKYRRKSEDFFDDCKPIIDLIDSGKMIAYIHSISVYHNTIRDLSHFIKKQRWATQNAISKKDYGVLYRINKLTHYQQLRITFWPFYALSFIFPIFKSIYGLIQDKDPIWLFHPIACWLSAYSSISAIIHYNLTEKKYISRQ